METTKAEELLSRLADMIDFPPYDESDRLLLSRTLTVTSLHFAASVRALCRDDLLLGASAVLRSQFEALVRSIWAFYRATDAQVEKLSTDLSAQSQQANKNIPTVTEMLVELEKYSQLQDLLVSFKEFKDSSWQPLNSFVHAGIHAVHWTRWAAPPQLLGQVFLSSNGLAVIAFQCLAILTGRPALQRDVIAACTTFSSCLPGHRKAPDSSASDFR
jgi:hypothetical protein